MVNFFSKSFFSFDVGGLFTLGVGDPFNCGDFDLGDFDVGGDFDLLPFAGRFYCVNLACCLCDSFGECVVISCPPMVSGSESF